MKFSSADIVRATGGTELQPGGVGQICTDTRAIQPGDWFLAIVGDRFDGHDFLDVASGKGAAGCIISAEKPDSWLGGCIRVSDTVKAYQDMGVYARAQLKGPVVGLTGTTGKTTTRAMISCALGASMEVHQTQANLNNHLGVPMTLLATPDSAQVVVLEMGTSSPGEIQFLAELATPDVRIVLNVGAGHLEELGGLDGVAVEKGSLVRTATPGQIALLNADDPRVANCEVPNGVQVLTWGRSMNATIRLINASVDPVGLYTSAEYETPVGRLAVCFNAPGEHLAHNGACALTVAMALGVDLKEAASALCSYSPVGMRQRIEMIPPGIRCINDAYNANPVSMIAALETLAGLKGRRVAVLGDMLELGPDAQAYHLEVLDRAAALELEQIVLVGEIFGELAKTSSGLNWFSGISEAVTYLDRYLQTGDQVLFKGSRGSRVERILNQLQEQRI